MHKIRWNYSMTSIGIFKGKKRVYNQAVLKTLYIEGPLKSWELAKRLQRYVNKDNSMPKTQDIYGILVRKKGRLVELHNKEYIVKDVRDPKRWEISLKGIIAIVIDEPNILHKINVYYLDQQPSSIHLSPLQKGDIGVKFTSKGREIKRLEFDPYEILNPDLIKRLANVTLSYINKGLNLDKVNQIELLYIILQKFKDLREYILSKNIVTQ